MVTLLRAVVQMAVMIFKRAVFETRKKPKVAAAAAPRQKQQANVKEVAQVLYVCVLYELRRHCPL